MFCKNCGKEISDSVKFCKYCGSPHNKPNGSTENTYSTPLQSSQDYSKLSQKNKSNWGRWVWAIIFIFFLFWLFSDSGSSTSSNNSYNNTYTPPPKSTIDTSAFDVSLANGTVFKKSDYYLSGQGDLEIDNGTQYDAVAKLIRGNTAIYSVYIKAKSTYTITGISDGNYELIFTQGSDWNSNTKSFNKNQSYETFEDTFDFETTSSQTTIWEVSLRERVGGNAETNTISPSEFNKY